ncbi:hypothetical protein Tco_0407958 [Tanacetum coccineum]
MSDSEESGITHTTVSSLYEDLSDIGSPRADDHELLEPPYMLEDPYAEAAFQAPPSPDYVPGPEEPEQAPPSPDYVPGPELADDEIVAGDQPYAEDASPMAHSPDDVPESDPEADPEEDDDEDPEEDPIDYSADGGDDGDDEMDIEEEHLAPAYPVVVALPATAPSAEETEPFETDESAATPPPHPAYRMTARISIPEPLPVPAWSDSEVARLLAISSPPASPLSPCPIQSLGYRAATIRMRAEAAATSHLLPLPPPFILSPTRPDAPPPFPTSAPTLILVGNNGHMVIKGCVLRILSGLLPREWLMLASRGPMVEVPETCAIKDQHSCMERQTGEQEGSLKTTSRNSQTSNNKQHIKRQNMAGASLLDRMIRHPMYGDLNPVLKVQITTMTSVCSKVHNATKSWVTSPVTVGVREMPRLLTTKGSL